MADEFDVLKDEFIEPLNNLMDDLPPQDDEEEPDVEFKREINNGVLEVMLTLVEKIGFGPNKHTPERVLQFTNELIGMFVNHYTLAKFNAAYNDGAGKRNAILAVLHALQERLQFIVNPQGNAMNMGNGNLFIGDEMDDEDMEGGRRRSRRQRRRSQRQRMRSRKQRRQQRQQRKQRKQR